MRHTRLMLACALALGVQPLALPQLAEARGYTVQDICKMDFPRKVRWCMGLTAGQRDNAICERSVRGEDVYLPFPGGSCSYLVWGKTSAPAKPRTKTEANSAVAALYAETRARMANERRQLAAIDRARSASSGAAPNLDARIVQDRLSIMSVQLDNAEQRLQDAARWHDEAATIQADKDEAALGASRECADAGVSC